jgi:hypothetical protein
MIALVNCQQYRIIDLAAIYFFFPHQKIQRLALSYPTLSILFLHYFIVTSVVFITTERLINFSYDLQHTESLPLKIK